MRAQGKTFPKCSARISGLNGKFWVFHTFPKSVYPTPLLTLKQRPNGAQTPAVFLYFSILNSLPTKKTSSFLSLQGLTDYDAILLEIYKAASCLFANEMMKCINTTIALLRLLGSMIAQHLLRRWRKEFFTVTIKQKFLTQSKKRLSELETKVDVIFSVSTALALR